MNTLGIFLIVSLAVCVPRAFAQESNTSKGRVAATLLCETATIQPNSTAFIGVRFQIEKGWHIYWDGTNESGMPPSFKVTLPEDCTMGQWLWPAPKRHLSPGDVLDHVYEDEVLLILPIRVGKTVKPDADLVFKVEADWLVCKSVCVPESGTLELTVPVLKDRAKLGDNAKLFTKARESVPKAWPTSHDAAPVWSGNTLTIRAKNAVRVTFFPGTDCPEVENLLKNGDVKSGTITLDFPKLSDLPARQQRITGVVELRYKDQKQPAYFSVDFPRPPGG